MIENYSARWKIESGFKELKHEIGALDNQARKQESVENHFELGCMAVTMTWIYAMKREKAPTKRLQNSRMFTFADIREEIRKEYTDKSIKTLDFVCSSPGIKMDMFFYILFSWFCVCYWIAETDC